MIPAGQDPFHFCYYRGDAYSEGAIIKADDGSMLRCSPSGTLAFSSDSKPEPLDWQALRNRS